MAADFDIRRCAWRSAPAVARPRALHEENDPCPGSGFDDAEDEHDGGAGRHRRRRRRRAPPDARAPTEDEPDDAPTTDGDERARKRAAAREPRRSRPQEAAAQAADVADEARRDGRAACREAGAARSGDRERARALGRSAPGAASDAGSRRAGRRCPQAKRELLISVDVGEQRVALLEDDQVAEVYLERPERRSIAGNIYLGIVDNVLPGMEAAFVEIGLEKNGFLYVDEIVVPELEGKRHGKKITDLIQRGQQILVQAVKDPMKTKGARLTTEISLPGPLPRLRAERRRARRLAPARRRRAQRLKDILKGSHVDGAASSSAPRPRAPPPRTSSATSSSCSGSGRRSRRAPRTRRRPELVYQEAELPLRIVRDLFAGDFVAAHVDHDRTYKRIVGYLKKTSPHMVERVHRYKEKEPLFERYGVDQEIASTLDRRVDLPSGGYLVFDYAEAFTVIDVNTGRFVGSRSKTSTQRLEDTIDEEQPRGGEGGRPPAAAPRHRRDHRHRLHRHGEPEEPRRRSRRRCAPSSSATARRPTSSRSRRSASSR